MKRRTLTSLALWPLLPTAGAQAAAPRPGPRPPTASGC
jgi:hypothetical protein